MTDLDRRTRRLHRLDERGIALPIALMGVVIVSVLLTAVLITASTEAASSRAHRDAVQGLHVAENGLQSYFADQNDPAAFVQSYVRPAEAAFAAVDPNQVCAWPATYDAAQVASYAPRSGGSAVRLQVQRLSCEVTETFPDDGTPKSWESRYSLVATPALGGQGGRRVGAVVSTTQTRDRISATVSAALMSGTNLDVKGNVKISGISGSTCSNESLPDTVAAITFAQGADFVASTNEEKLIKKQNIEGAIEYAGYTNQQMLKQALGVDSVAELAKYADVKFGSNPPPAQPAFDGSNPSSSNPKDSRYNWGKCVIDASGNCGPGSYAKIVFIDAQGGEIHINGNGDGYGMLFIKNGDFFINGTFMYKGVIVVEGGTTIAGTADVYGALITLGVTNVESTATSSVGSGTPIVKYDQCRITETQQQLNSKLNETSRVNTSADVRWYEVVN